MSMRRNNNISQSDEDRFLELFSKALEAATKNAEEKNPILLKKQHVWKSNYGLDDSNPIISENLEGTSAYLARLCTPDGRTFTWSGYTSIRASVHGLPDVGEDKYTLYLDGHPYTDLFFVPYVGKAEFPPAGLCFIDDNKDWEKERRVAKRADELGIDIETTKRILELEAKDQEIQAKRTARLRDAEKEISLTYPGVNIQEEIENPLFKALFDLEFNPIVVYEYVHSSILLSRRKQSFSGKEQPSPGAAYYRQIFLELYHEELEKLNSFNSQDEITGAAQMGVPLDTYREIHSREYAILKSDWEKRLSQINDFSSQAVELKKQYPGFNLKEEVQHEVFKKLLEKVNLREAYEILHFSECFVTKMDGSNSSVSTETGKSEDIKDSAEGTDSDDGQSAFSPPSWTSDEEEMSEEDAFSAFLRKYSKEENSPDKKSPVGGAARRTSSPGGNPESTDPPAAEPKASSDEAISQNTTAIVQGNLPVLLEKRVIYRKPDQTLYAVCSFSPITDTPILAMQADILCYNVWREQIESVEKYQFSDLNTSRGISFGSEFTISLPDSSTRSINIIVRRLMLADGTLIQRNEENVELPSLENLDRYLGDRQFTHEYKSLTYANAKYAPVKAGPIWRCTCGAINRNEEETCHECADSAETLFKYLDKNILQASIDEKERAKQQKEEQERLAREEAEKAAEEERRVRALKEAEEERVRKEKRRHRNTVLAVCGAVVAVVAVAIYLIGWHLLPSIKYHSAEKMLNTGDKDAAYEAFINLNGFKDSQDRAFAIKYADADNALSNGDYDTAIALFSSISAYSDSATREKEAIYQKALKLKGEGSFVAAAELFESIPDYHNSQELGSVCRSEDAYLCACEDFQKGDYEKAGNGFEALGTYRDSSTMAVRAYYLHAKELIEGGMLHEGYEILAAHVNQGENSYEDSIELANTSEYQYASDCFTNGSYAAAAESFSNLGDYEDSATRYLESRYQYGLELINEGKYDTAESVFIELGEYKDSTRQINESIYQHGVTLLDAGKYDEAIEVLGRLTNYRDSSTQLNEAKYQKALQLLDQKEYILAARTFEELGNYRDSATQLKESKYQRALSLVAEKKYYQAVPIFKELGTYSDSVDQWKSAMYAYVAGHKNNDDRTTYEYLSELSKASYLDSKTLYDSLYSWTATIVINDSSSDSTTNKQSLTTSDEIHCHFKLQGGPPGEAVALRAVGYFPDGSHVTVNWNGDNEWRRGWSGSPYFWYNDPSYGAKGTFTFKLYAGSELIAEKSIRIK